MKDDIAQFVRSCLCSFYKGQPLKRLRGEKIIVDNELWHMISIDHFGPLKKFNNAHILVIIDHFSRYVILRAVPDTSASVTAEELFKVFCLYGWPNVVLSDRGSGFVSNLMKTWTQRFRVIAKHTTAYHPATNGKAERINQMLKTALSMIENNKDWKNFLPGIQQAYNTAYHSVIDTTPYFIMFGHNPRLPLHLILNAVKEPYEIIKEKGESTPDMRKCVDQLVQRIQKSYECVIKAQAKESQRRLRYITKRKVPGYQVGDKVLVYDFRPTRHKLLQKWNGPYDILERYGDKGLVIKHSSNKHAPSELVNENRVKLYIPWKAYEKYTEVVLPEETQQFEIEELLRREIINKVIYYLVKWVGYEKPTWENEANLPKLLKDKYIEKIEAVEDHDIDIQINGDVNDKKGESVMVQEELYE